MNLWLNIAVFQVGWFACVLSGAHALPWGTVFVLAAVAIHLFLATRARNEALLILCAALLGFVVDTVLIRAGWLEFTSGILISGTAPHWMVALWMIFATTLNISLRWLKKRLLLAAALGAAGGPLAYYAGAKLGALTLVGPDGALLAIGVAWALAMPFLLMVANRFDGTPHSKSASEVRCV